MEHQPRRRRKELVLPTVSQDNKLMIKKKRRRKSDEKWDNCYFLLLFLSIGVGCFGISFLVVKLTFTFLQPSSDPHGLNLDLDLYHDIQEIFKTESTDYDEVEEYMRNHVKAEPYVLSSLYGENIEKCELTVVMMDPRIPMQPAGSPVWFALESIGAFTPYACVTLQTSSCEVQPEVSVDNLDAVHQEISERIYERSMPLFRKMIHQGQVRVTILNHKKYQLKSCSNFWNPSYALMNKNYWTDEFLDEIDSDTILTIQDDSVLCHHLNIDKWKQFSFVGAIWPKVASPLNLIPVEGMCVGMPSRWKRWLLPQRRWRRWTSEEKKKGHKMLPKPDKLLDESYPDICDDGIAPVGNGGLSIRSRRWMIDVINTCPHLKYSGFDAGNENLACKVVEEINEDLYFGTVLLGIGAPLPSAFEASLFSSEMMLLEQAVDMYGSNQNQNEAVIDLWGHEWSREGLFYRGVLYNETYFTVPIGFHKPWWYMPNRLLLSDEMVAKCPFIPFIFNPLDSRWSQSLDGIDPWTTEGIAGFGLPP